MIIKITKEEALELLNIESTTLSPAAQLAIILELLEGVEIHGT